MPRIVRPFPYPLNIGTDICHIPRIYSILNSARAARFVRRVLTEEEAARRGQRVSPIARILQNDAGIQKHGESTEERSKVKSLSDSQRSHAEAERESELWEAAVFMAGRFAAKEAAIKAHPHRHLTFHDITIAPRASADAEETAQPRLGSGPPIAIIKAVDAESPDQEAMISISHDGDYATAVCMGFV